MQDAYRFTALASLRKLVDAGSKTGGARAALLKRIVDAGNVSDALVTDMSAQSLRKNPGVYIYAGGERVCVLKHDIMRKITKREGVVKASNHDPAWNKFYVAAGGQKDGTYPAIVIEANDLALLCGAMAENAVDAGLVPDTYTAFLAEATFNTMSHEAVQKYRGEGKDNAFVINSIHEDIPAVGLIQATPVYSKDITLTQFRRRQWGADKLINEMDTFVNPAGGMYSKEALIKYGVRAEGPAGLLQGAALITAEYARLLKLYGKYIKKWKELYAHHFLEETFNIWLANAKKGRRDVFTAKNEAAIRAQNGDFLDWLAKA